MGEMLKTCSACTYLKIYQLPMGVAPCCGLRERLPIVPHQQRPVDDGRVDLTFWRVPLECPLPDDESLKGADKIHPYKWEQRFVDTKGCLPLPVENNQHD